MTRAPTVAVVLGLTNRTLAPVTVELAPGDGIANGRGVPSDEAVGDRVNLPALDGVFVEYDLR